MIDSLVVDANPMLSALLGGRAREVLFDRRLALFSPQTTLFEVERYLPFVARKLGQSELDLFREFELLPITAVQPQTYESEFPRATELIGWRDPKDVPVLALALRLRLPIWTEDRRRRFHLTPRERELLLVARSALLIVTISHAQSERWRPSR